jgi:uncharacterized protein YndB with AHSA1/START domain
VHFRLDHDRIQVATEVGDAYRYEWAADDGFGRFGFEGELLEFDPPRRSVSTERITGEDGPGAINEMWSRAISASSARSWRPPRCRPVG